MGCARISISLRSSSPHFTHDAESESGLCHNGACAWLLAAHNSVEMASLPWSILAFSGASGNTLECKQSDECLEARLRHLEAVLTERGWLAQVLMCRRHIDVGGAARCLSIRQADRMSRLPGPGRPRHGLSRLCEGPRRPVGAFCCGSLRGPQPPDGRSPLLADV